MSRSVTHRVGEGIALLTIAAGGGQLLLTGRALASLGLPIDEATLFLFRLASVMVLLFGVVIWHDLRRAEDGLRRGVLWGGVQKIGTSLLMIAGLLGNQLDTLAWGVVAWDSVAGAFLLWLAGRGKKRSEG